MGQTLSVRRRGPPDGPAALSDDAFRLDRPPPIVDAVDSATRRVVIVGASVAGLFAAAAAASAGCEVTVLERDDTIDDPGPHAGVPQGRQPHVFLYRGLLSLEELLPGIRADLVGRGAVPIDTGNLAWLGEQGWLATGVPFFEIVSMTRPLFEDVVRRRVLALPGVRIRGGARVSGLRRSGPRWQVQVAGGEPVDDVDLVIDASGRASRLPSWLAELGVGTPEVIEVDAGVGYATCRYRLPAADVARRDRDFVGLVVLQTPATPRGGLVLPVEEGDWLVTGVGSGESRPPRDSAGFTAFLGEIRDPAFADLVRTGIPVGEVAVHRQTANRRHRYEKLTDWPDNLLVMGDAFCAFNPIYGQGITVAALEALLLRRALRTGLRPGSSATLLAGFARTVALPWSIATSEDLRYPASAGRQTPTQVLLGRWSRTLGALAASGDARAQNVLGRVYHLMASPALLFDPMLMASAIRARVRGFGPPVPRPPSLAELGDHPSRREPV
jgi:2-polyprenyl-6-methoxyphenol hydroxylase-like FAD-dependent oxidoreductase